MQKSVSYSHRAWYRQGLFSVAGFRGVLGRWVVPLDLLEAYGDTEHRIQGLTVRDGLVELYGAFPTGVGEGFL